MSKTELGLTEICFFFRLLVTRKLYTGEWRFACFSGHLGTLLYARLLRLFRLRRRVYLLNFYLHSLGQRKGVKRALRFLLTDDVHLVAQTTSDARYFSEFLPEENIKHVPYCLGQSPHVRYDEVVTGDYVFSGGWTNRDYDALFRCAGQVPSIPFVVVASRSSKLSVPPPPNVRLLFDVDVAKFDRLLSRSRLVVIPLADDVGSSGQMVLLAAMQFAKTVVVPRVGAVADYVEHDRTGVFYDRGDDTSLGTVIATLYADSTRINTIGAAARKDYLNRFTPENFNRPVAHYIAEASSPSARAWSQ